MLRRLRTIVIFGLLGAVLTVGVSWLLVLRGPPDATSGFYFSHETGPLWYFSRVHSTGSDWVICGVTPLADVGGWECRPDLCPAWSLIAARPGVEHIGADSCLWLEEARGWPFLALTSRVRLGDGLAVESSTWAIPVGRRAGEPVPAMLPLRPFWPGFLGNTLLGAVLLFGARVAPGAIRRCVRLRRGRCERCAYPIGTSLVCTECGAELARARGGATSRA